MMIRAAFVAAALAIAGSSSALAQAQFTTPNGTFVPGAVAMCLDANGHAVATNQSSACPGGGGGGGGLSVPYGGAIGANGTPVGLKDPATGFLQPFQGDTTNGLWANLKTAADGAIVTLGAKADPAWVSGDGAVISLLKAVDRDIINGTITPGTAGTPSSSVLSVQGVASMTPIQVSQATAASLNATVVGTGTFAAQATQAGTWTVQPGNTANSTPWLFTPTPTSGQGATPYHLSGGTTASTNSNSVKAASAGTGIRWTLINTNASTIGYLKVYDSAAAPTCSSATGIKHVYPILAGPGGLQVIDMMGEAFALGIGYCVTGGGGDTDNTSAPTGIYVEGSYK